MRNVLSTKFSTVIFFVLIGIFLLLLSVYFRKNVNSDQTLKLSKNYIVTLTSDGFSPSEITVRKGDTITFKSNIVEDFWPASDPHPIHSIDSEFDPQQPINSSSSWVFKFDKLGSWRFHDHLQPLYRGIVNVTGSEQENIETKNELALSIQNKCKDIKDLAQKTKCWENLIYSDFNDKGLDIAFDTILSLYQNDQQFQSSCHGFVHELGEKSYLLFSQDKDFNIPPQVSYCSFGFYHGFMQKLLHQSGNLKEAQDFCYYADRQLSKISSGTIGTCFHGMGHGAVDDRDGSWPNEQVMVKPALKLCEQAAPTDVLLNRCASGVFNAMAIAYNNQDLAVNKTDPLWYCRTFEKDYAKSACYQEMNTTLLQISANNFNIAQKFVADIPEDNYAKQAMESLSAVNGQLGINLNDYKVQIKDCLGVSDRLVTSCIKGYVPGLIQVGQPNLEYEKPLVFCNNKLLSEEQKMACYGELIWQISNIFSPEKQKAFCLLIDKKYNKGCLPS